VRVSPALIVHGGAGTVPEDERAIRQEAVERGLEAGWKHIGESALAAVVAAVRHLEDEPTLNAGVGAVLNRDGVVELDAAVMEGSGLRTGAVGAVRDVRHPIDLALMVMERSEHVLLVGEGASQFAAAHGVEPCDPAVLVTEHQRKRWLATSAGVADTVGAVARDVAGHMAVAVSTGGVPGKLPGRVGDSALVGAGLYADDRLGAACGTGRGEAFVRTALCKVAVDQLASTGPQRAADAVLRYLRERAQARGGIIVVGRFGEPVAALTTEFMPWARRVAR